jgi:hypothetical protein
VVTTTFNLPDDLAAAVQRRATAGRKGGAERGTMSAAFVFLFVPHSATRGYRDTGRPEEGLLARGFGFAARVGDAMILA